MRRILIYSEPVHSGKSSRLIHWSSAQPCLSGFICPDLNYARKLFDINTGILHEFQVHENDDRPTTVIGHYSFLQEGFERAHVILSNLENECQIAGDTHWWLVDEIGKLELKGLGFEPAFSRFLQTFKHQGKGNLLLVVRDYLLTEVIQYYALDQYEVIGHDWFD